VCVTSRDTLFSCCQKKLNVTGSVRFCSPDLQPLILSCRKPKNARSKRVLEARAPKEVEDPRTAVFVKGTHTGEVLNNAMKELVSNLFYFFGIYGH
jgi:hypothetical protein